jgi:hypothetical protein
MIDPTDRLRNLASTEGIVSSSSRSQTRPSQSFAAELSDKLAGAKSASQATALSVSLPASLPAGQQSVTWRDPGGTSGSTSTSGSASTAAFQPTGLNALVSSYITGTTSGTTSGAESTPEAAPPPAESFDQAYWASQPPAVQQLQYMQDSTQRAQVASQLEQQGYSIDEPIMVWGWDPQITTQLRQADGYTWVPSAQQQPVEVAPGLTFGGASYNPSSPPPGSITV